MKITYYGVRGSIPVSGVQFDKFGGETTCVAIETRENIFIIDSGTGIRLLGTDLLKREFGKKDKGGKAHILFTHTHWDHIQGFPFFVPAFLPWNSFQIYGETKNIPVHYDSLDGELETWSIEKTLQMQQTFMFFPISTHQMSSKLSFHEISAGDTLEFSDVKVSTLSVQHPNSTLAFRFSTKSGDYVFATDFEHGNGMEEKIIEFARGAKAIAVDAQYTPEEYAQGKTGWGHSTYEIGAKIAKEAGIEELHLIHHDPGHIDSTIDEIEKQAKKHFPNTVAIPEGHVYEIK